MGDLNALFAKIVLGNSFADHNKQILNATKNENKQKRKGRILRSNSPLSESDRREWCLRFGLCVFARVSFVQRHLARASLLEYLETISLKAVGKEKEET